MDWSNGLGVMLRAGLAVLVLLGIYIAARWLKKGNAKGWRELLDMLTVTMKRKIILFMVMLGLVVCLAVLAPLARFDAGVDVFVTAFLGTAWIILVAWALTLLLTVLTGLVQWKYDIGVEDNLGARQINTKVRVLHRIAAVLVWLGALAGILMQFERFRALGGAMLASAGVLSIVLGLSAQKTFGAVIAGVQIALTHPINLDDVVIVEGEWGRIEEITFTYVVVKIWDLRRMVVPISYFVETPFQNWTKKSAEIIGTVTLHVDYTTPLQPLREELKSLCEASGALWNGKTCVLQVTEAGGESMTVRALVSSPGASAAWDLRCMVREGLIDFLRRNYPESLPRRRVVLQDEAMEKEAEKE